MDIRKVPSSVPIVYNNKNRQLPAEHITSSRELIDNTMHNACQSRSASLEKINETDITLYQEVQGMPEHSLDRTLLSVSIYV